MPCRDFFAFCTSLQPMELKALGVLSEARHIEEGVTICRAGEESEALYIVNRGTLEVLPPTPTPAGQETYLSRGDIFGDVDALAAQPCEYHIRTCEPVSLRCFRKEHFPELIKRVPTFFFFLSEQLADRLLRARRITVAPAPCLELSGSLRNFDLVTIYQTIVNSSQTGELSICDEHGDLVSAFFFENGQPRGAKFQHLTGEEAFWQLFLAADLRGTFSFTSGDTTGSTSIAAGKIARSAGDMLISALQARDEFHSLRNSMAAASSTLERRTRNLELSESVPAATRAVMHEIWNLPFEGNTPVHDLFSQLAVSELRIYQAVHEMLKTGQITLSPVALPAKVA